MQASLHNVWYETDAGLAIRQSASAPREKVHTARGLARMQPKPYVLYLVADKDRRIVKVGTTARDRAHLRLRDLAHDGALFLRHLQLSTSHRATLMMARRWPLGEQSVFSAARIEKLAHRELLQLGVPNYYEWYAMPVGHALEIVEAVWRREVREKGIA